MRPEQWDIFKRASRLEKLNQDADGHDHRQPLDPGLRRREAHGFLPGSAVLVPVAPENPPGISRHHLRPRLVDGIRHGGRAVGPRVEDQVLAGQHAERISHALQHRGHRQAARIRGRGRRFHGDDAPPPEDAAPAGARHRRDLHHGHRARADVHRRLRAQHERLHVRPGREAGIRAQAPRPLHAPHHRLAQGAGEDRWARPSRASSSSTTSSAL